MNPSERVKTIITPSGPLSIIRSVAERLLQEGIISGDLNGTLHAADAITVKAAMMTHGVCDFCSTPGVEHVFDVPDFDLPLSGGLSRSTDGWATCGPCGELVKANRRKDLFARAISSLAFAKFTKDAIQELHNRFWRGLEGMQEAAGMADSLADFVNDKLPDPPVWSPEITDRADRVRALAKITGLTIEEVEQAVEQATHGEMTPTLAMKLQAWGKKFGYKKLDSATLTSLIGGPRKPMPPVTPHWQRALDAKLEVVRTLGGLLSKSGGSEYFPEAVDLHDMAAVKKMALSAKARQTFRGLGFEQDYKLLPSATVYSFSGETEAAIIEASHSIPCEAPLSSIETPTGCGWFWFSEPLDVAASPAASDHTHALLWSWVKAVGVPEDPGGERTMTSLLFSAYVIDEKDNFNGTLGGVGTGALNMFPSTRWYWPLHMSFHDMLKFNGDSWQKTYGPGTALEGDPHIISMQETVKVIADLSLFFVQACLWFRQTVPGTQKKLDPILTQSPGHIERHARKRAQKELKLDEAPVVHVVALRKTARTEVLEPVAHGEHGEREYRCRWIVKGHPRLQACGPGRKDRKLIWIEAHPAGPEDKPLRTKTTVFAVVR